MKLLTKILLEILYQIFLKALFWKKLSQYNNNLIVCLDFIRNKTGHKPKFFYEIIEQNFLDMLYQYF